MATLSAACAIVIALKAPTTAKMAGISPLSMPLYNRSIAMPIPLNMASIFCPTSSLFCAI